MKHVNEVFSLENTESKTNVNINVTLSDNVTSIGKHAFEDCSSLTSVVIPDSVTDINGDAFLGCTNLKTVNYKGTQEQWGQISIGNDNGNLISATVNYNYTGE
ncbi:MAG: leucine-rich repeat protein [Spirochaetota bacterium]|nr:leucine-rich repeat protein [Spirochaetota bacterium]